jgi:hypothetical protein
MNFGHLNPGSAVQHIGELMAVGGSVRDLVQNAYYFTWSYI